MACQWDYEYAPPPHPNIDPAVYSPPSIASPLQPPPPP